MIKKNLNLFIIASTLAIATGSACAATPGLWDGVAAMPPQSIQLQDEALEQSTFEYISLSPVYFDSNRATLTHAGQQALDAASDYLQKHDSIKRILIEGHTDAKGGIAFNDNLSDRRALVVRNYLTIKGVDPELINMIGMGEHQPVDQNWTREGRQRNRHVSIYAVHWNR